MQVVHYHFGYFYTVFFSMALNKAKLVVLVFNRGRVLEALMEQKASGKIKGIFGRLVRDFK